MQSKEGIIMIRITKKFEVVTQRFLKEHKVAFEELAK